MEFKHKIQSILFVAGRPVSIKELSKTLDAGREDIKKALEELRAEHQNSGIVLLEQGETYLLSTNADNTKVVKDFLNAELRERLTDSSLETLAIVAYKQPVHRAEIEAIRGVSSQYTLRLLTMRGLIEKIPDPGDARQNLYRTTHEFLQHLGLTSPKDLPEFEELTKAVKPPEVFISQTPSPGDGEGQGEVEK